MGPGIQEVLHVLGWRLSYLSLSRFQRGRGEGQEEEGMGASQPGLEVPILPLPRGPLGLATAPSKKGSGKRCQLRREDSQQPLPCR